MAALRWCVAQTKPREEELAARQLRQQAFNVFHPLLREHQGRESRLVPMFPRYLFIQVNHLLPVSWAPINGTRGVKRVITSSMELPSLLPIGWVETLRAAGDVLDRFLDALDFAAGDLVEFVDGPFKGQQGVCKWTGEKRVALLLAVLGRETMVVSDPRALRPVRKDPQVAVR